MKKFILSMLLAVLMLPFATRADELVIGDGTGSGYYSPFNNYYKYSWNETIYQASEFDGSASISSIAYHCASTDKTVNATSVKIYMGETTKSEFASSSDWTPESDLTLVYEGSSIVLGDTEWEEFVLDQPFVYSGVNNLVVVVAKSASNYNSSLKWYYTDYGNKPCMYLQSDGSASYAEYPTQSGVQYAYSPDIKINYVTVPSGPVTVAPEVIDLGARPNGAWMRPAEVTIKPIGAYSNISAIETTNAYFEMSDVELPTTIYNNNPLTMEIVHGEGEGDINGQLAIFYKDERGIEFADMTAFAYDPVANDVWETAETINGYSFTDTPTGVYDNYLLPGETPDGEDVVYKVTFNEDVLLTANVDGADPKVAIYGEDFGGEPGPGATNMYAGIEISDTPALPSAAWLKYDNGTFYTSIGVGEQYSFYWGVKFTPEDLQQYAATTLTKISMYDYAAHTGYFFVYQGGETAPETALYYQEYAGTGSAGFVEYNLDVPVAIDPTKSLWIIAANNQGVGYPAAASAFTGDANGSWCSLNGTTWYDVASPSMLGQPLTWMLRGYVQDNAKGEVVLKAKEIKKQDAVGTLASAMPLDNTRGRGNDAINNMVVPAGTYYIAASSTSEFTVNVNAESIPVPAKPYNPNPENLFKDFNGQLLSWEFGDYTLEYQVLFGTAYPPRDVVVDWTNELTSVYPVVDLYNNKNYFWQVNVRNTSGTTYGDVWAFTTPLNIPTIVDITSNQLYPGESTTIGWNPVQDRTYRGYNVYVNGVKDNNAVITETSYTVEGLEYNMEGHELTVTAVYDEGESDHSNVARVYVTGNGSISGNVYELDSITAIAGGTVAITGTDAFGNSQSYNFEIDANGKFSGELLEGEYQAVATVENYQNAKVRFEVAYNEETIVDVIMTEVYTPVAYVEATEVEEGVQVVWGMQKYGGGGEDFETGDFSANEWNNTVSEYPWVIVEGGNESNYAMRSDCAGIDYGVSAIEITVEVPFDGFMSFDYKISSEQAYDLGKFYIDGTTMATFSGEAGWATKKVAVTEGVHVYRWEYSKDVMWESGEDAFYVDNIEFCFEPEPFTGGWLHYDDGVYATSIGTGQPSPCYWGISFPAKAEYAGYTIDKVAVYDASPDYAGSYTVNIYLGGDNAPGTLVSSQTATLTGVGDYVEIALDTPVAIDGTQMFWITIYTADLTYPAAGCSYAGDPNSDWISLDGIAWDHAGPTYNLEYSWMVRAYMNNAKGETAVLGNVSFEGGASTGTFAAAENVTPKHVGMPEVVFGQQISETTKGNRALSAYNVLRRDVIRNEEVTLVEHHADTAYLDNTWSSIEASVYQWGVSAYYEGNRVVEETEAINEGFEGGTMPQGWTTIDEGTSLTAPWIVAALSGAGNFYPYDGTFAAYSAGSSAGGNYYLITPVINTDGLESATISFQFINPAWAGDNNDLEVAISSTPAGPWTTVWSSNGMATSTWSEATIEVTDYTDSEMYVAFINIDGWGYCTAIDNVLVNVVTNKGGSEVVWSKPLEKDMTATVTVNVSSNNGDPVNGTKVTFVNLIEDGIVFTATIDETGTYVFNDFRKGTYELTVEKNGYTSNVVNEVVEIWDDAMFTAELTEELSAVAGLYVSPTGWAMWQGSSVGGGDEFAYSFEDGMEGWTSIDANSDGHSWYHNSAAGDHGTLSSDSHTGAGHLMSESYCNATWASMEPDDYIVSPSQVAIGGGSVLRFWACAQDANYQAEHFGVAISTGSNTSAADFTTVSEWTIGAKVDAKGAARGSRDATPWVQYEVDLSEYAGQSAWIAIRHFGCYDQFILLVDDIELTGAAKANRALEGYTVMLDGVVETESLEVTYFQHEGLVDGTEYTTTVIANYTSGDSEEMSYTWTKVAESSFASVEELTAQYKNEAVELTWSFAGNDPTPGGQTFNYGFESGTDGWTTINANGDDHTWYHSTEAGNHGTLAATSHGGSGHMMSESYCNASWASMSPDDYLVSPQKYAITADSKISFWACAQDANYQAEHFGVAVSTAGNTSASDFTTISEWTIGAKVNAKGAARGDRDQTTWVQYEVDLSSYAGQEVYVAIRHFNCYDQFILLVDDVEVVVGGGGNGDDNQGSSVSYGFESGTDGWTTINANGDDHTWYHSTEAGNHGTLAATSHGGSGHMMSESYCNASWASMSPDDYLVSPEKYAVTSSSKVTFWACAQDANYQAEHFGVAISTAGNTSASDFTTISEWTIGAKVNAKGAARGDRDQTTWVQYEVDLSSYAGQEVYVAIRHFNCYDQFILLVDDIEISAGGNGGGNDDDDDDDPIDSMSWDFETGMDGWTNIDADGDGSEWYHNVDYGLTGDGAYGNGNSVGFVFSQSYDNYFGPLYPDNYLVSPSKIAVSAGSKISFYACAQDESYGAEHFGVAVSTAGNTSGSDFTTISEWTISAKGDRQGDRSLRQSSWVKYEADLSAYAGQNVWVAIRHFNCSDQYFLDVDDITISTSKKENAKRGNNSKGLRTTYGFESGDEGWTTINANGDDHTWYHNSEAESHSVLTADSHGGTGHMMSESFCNATGAAMVPDDYLVSPQKYAITADSKVTFWACAQDELWAAEHFGVAISTAGNTSASDFTTISEWTIGYKSAKDGVRNVKGQRQTTWVQYEVDLSAYAGQEVWVAIRHFDCTDMFILLIDDITINADGENPDPNPDPEPSEDVLGVMIYKNGELLTSKPVEGTTYTDKNGIVGDEYCVRVVYAGEPDVTYYAMSEPTCVEADVIIDCVAPVDLFAEQTGNDEVTLKLSYNPNPVGDWLYYDNGTNEDAIGGPAEFQWGIMFPAESLAAYEGTSFTKVSLFDYSASSGDIKVYYGGTNAPQELVHSQPYSVSGTGAFVEFDLTAALPVDPTMNVWVTFTTSQGTSYPAAVSANTGDANGRWISLDGSVWEDIVDYGLSNTWMMRAYVTNAKGEVSSLAPIADEGFTATGGELAVAGAARATSALSHYNVYRGTSENNMTVIGETSTKTYVDSDVAEGTYYYAMTAVYEEGGETCESDPANAYGSDETFVVVTVTSIDENGVEGMMIYPNPTKDNVTISAEGIERITITNALGQVMLDRVVNSDSEILNMGQYEAGVYMVRIVTANGVATERITVL